MTSSSDEASGKINFCLELVRMLLEEGIILPEQIKGWSDEEIRQLEAAMGYPIPGAYKEFLQVMGHGAGEFLSDSEVFLSGPADVFTLKEWANRVLQKGGYPPLADEAFVFDIYLRDIFFYFYLGSTAYDPEIFPDPFYGSDPDLAEDVPPTFWGWLLQAVEGTIEGERYGRKLAQSEKERASGGK